MAAIPDRTTAIQDQEVKVERPISESTLFGLAGLINYLWKTMALPVGTIRKSNLDTFNFGQTYGGNWVLANGQDVTGSKFETLTGQSTVPDMRGLYLRGFDNGKGTDDPGHLIGTFQDDEIKAHNHTFKSGNNQWAGVHTFGNQTYGTYTDYMERPEKTDDGAIMNNGLLLDESRPKSLMVNYFIKIN